MRRDPAATRLEAHDGHVKRWARAEEGGRSCLEERLGDGSGLGRALGAEALLEGRLVLLVVVLGGDVELQAGQLGGARERLRRRRRSGGCRWSAGPRGCGRGDAGDGLVWRPSPPPSLPPPSPSPPPPAFAATVISATLAISAPALAASVGSATTITTIAASFAATAISFTTPGSLRGSMACGTPACT